MDGVAPRTVDRAALQIADQAGADAGSFGKFLLGQVNREPQALEMLAKRQKRRLSCHVFAGSHDNCLSVQ
jgi:hypothetical protein